MVKVEVLHCEISVPAAEVVELTELVNITSSVEVHEPFVIVHLKVALLPCVIPVTAEVLNVGVVIVAVPETTLHKPDPVVGLFPDKVKAVLQLVISVPADEIVGLANTVNEKVVAELQVGVYEIV